jgi:hypothetical protein
MLDLSNRTILVGQNEPDPFLNANSKGILREDQNSIAAHFDISPVEIAKAFERNEIPMDVTILLDELDNFVQ